MKHLNFVEPIPQAGEVHLNLFGSGINEEAERVKKYEEAKAKFPYDPKTGSCDQLQTLIENVALDIRQMEERIARGDTNRVGKRYVDGFNRWKTELEQFKNNMQCVKIQEEQEKQEFFETQNKQLEQVKKIAGTTNKTSTYILVGMIGLVLTVSGIIIYKKIKKS